MKYKRVIKKLNELESFSIDELLKEYEITVFTDDLINDKRNDALLITGCKKSILYIKENLDEQYTNFLILHEIGHRVFHFRQDAQYSYLQSQYTGRMEREANMFACMYLLQDEQLDEVSALDVLLSKGVPEQIILQFLDDVI